MDRELSREEFYAALGGVTKAVDSGFAQVNARLDKLNGKTERHGEAIAAINAVQRVAAQVLEDDPPRSSKKNSAIGAGVAAGVVVIVEAIKALWK
jgi:hypothetical protein